MSRSFFVIISALFALLFSEAILASEFNIVAHKISGSTDASKSYYTLAIRPNKPCLELVTEIQSTSQASIVGGESMTHSSCKIGKTYNHNILVLSTTDGATPELKVKVSWRQPIRDLAEVAPSDPNHARQEEIHVIQKVFGLNSKVLSPKK